MYHGSVMVPYYYYGIYYGILDILPWYFGYGMDITMHGIPDILPWYYYGILDMSKIPN